MAMAAITLVSLVFLPETFRRDLRDARDVAGRPGGREGRRMTATNARHIVLILADDMGFSDIGCYGGEIHTPNLDALAGRRAAVHAVLQHRPLLPDAGVAADRPVPAPGRHRPHELEDAAPTATAGDLNRRVRDDRRGAAAGRLLARTCRASGTSPVRHGRRPTPAGRPGAASTGSSARSTGAGSFYRPAHPGARRARTSSRRGRSRPSWLLHRRDRRPRACGSSRSTSEEQTDKPFFLYVAYTAPHWPLHARRRTSRSTRGASTPAGTRSARSGCERLRQGGHRRRDLALAPRDARVPAWDDVADQAWEAAPHGGRTRRRSTAWTRASAGSSTQLSAGRLDNTLMLFLSDNGGCAEEMPPGRAPASS